MEIAGVRIFSNIDKYVGLPSLLGRSKVFTFNGLVDRVKSKLMNWKAQFLSMARKGILIKAVLQEISTYFMSVFLLSKCLCKKLNSLVSNFWWGP